MRVDGIIYATGELIGEVIAGGAIEQVANVATLPGIVGASLAMPDVHWGYGFCIGGVAATDIDEGGVVSPGGVGYDINCGVRLIRSDIPAADLGSRMRDLVNQLYRDIPAGVGVDGPYEFEPKRMRRLLNEGMRFLLEEGLASEADLATTESAGSMADADADAVSDSAIRRGHGQCGTMGAGNHFAEVQVVDEIFDEHAAGVLGLVPGCLTLMIHSGSRGLGHQVCGDFINALRKVPAQFGIHLPDNQLVCAPVNSEPGQRYLRAMRAAANFAWCNRQLLARQFRRSLASFCGQSEESLGLRQVYDVAHNIAKIETHVVAGRPRTLCVHRKGATRAFGPGHPELPPAYRDLGQPVLIPGDMGTASYVLTGTAGAMEQSFGSCCHGAGRTLSRTEALRRGRGRHIDQELAAAGVIARSRSREGLAEEQPDAYKDIDAVVNCVSSAGLAHKVARLRPVGVIKG
ncbi:MAG: RtcB family protein [Planctomycetota bacterium]|nr:RtcB family protein [Planctomycetota bacterium]